MKILKEHSTFVLLFLLCAALRFIPIFDYQFTFDELSGLDRTQFKSFSEVIEKGVKVDAHPALVQLMIYYLSRVFGYVTWIIKLPFLLFSLGVVLYAYAFGLRNFSKQSALFAALIFSFSLIFIFYAPIARMYGSGIFFSLGLLFYFFEIFFHDEHKIRNYYLFGLFALLGAVNQHLNALFALTVAVSGLLFLNKRNYKPYLLTCFFTLIAYLPHLPVTLYQFSIPGIGRDAGGWLEAPEFVVLFSFLKILFGTGKTYLIFLILVWAALTLNGKFSVSKQQVLLLGVFLLNFLIIYFYSLYRSPIYQHSAMLFSATALVLFVCSFIEFKNLGIFYGAFFLVFSVLIYKSYIKKAYLQEAVKTVYDYQFERTAHYKKLFGDADVFPLFFDCDTLMKKIYFKKYQTKFACKISSDSIISFSERKQFHRSGNSEGRGEDSLVSSIKLFSDFVAHLKSDYVVLSSSTPLYQAIVAEHFPFLIENTQTQAINYKVYSKKKGDRTKVVADDKVLYFSSVKDPGKFVYSKRREPFLLKVDSLNEFPFETKADYRDVIADEGEMILVRTTVNMKKPERHRLECIVSAVNTTTGLSESYSSKSAADFLWRSDSSVVIYSDAYVGTNFKKIKDHSRLSSYFWNRGRNEFEIREFEIKVIDYWPNKWHFWD
ncbi:MAG: glycosyltransferase family 39 protein [bacterium]|nr:glycosyltransferase family 39 protein [bacterium]